MSWRTVLRERQLAIDAADLEEFEAKKKYKFSSPSEEFVDSGISYEDVRSPELSSPSTADAAAVLLGTNVPNDQLIPSDGLHDSCECKIITGPSTGYSSAVENLATGQQEAATADSDVLEDVQQSSPVAVDYTDELKSSANCTADAESMGSIDFTESDQISSSVADSPSSRQQQPFESLSSTPEHLVSDSNVLNLTSDCSEMNIAGEVPQAFAEVVNLVESPLHVQSPDHKRTRRHAQKHAGRAKKKHRKAVEKAETKIPDDLLNHLNQPEDFVTVCDGHSSNTSDVHSLSKELDLGSFQYTLSDNDQQSQAVPDAVVTADFATQIVRQPSYLKAVGIHSENAVVSQQQNNCSDVTESGTFTQASKDHSSSGVSNKTDSKWLFYILALSNPSSYYIVVSNCGLWCHMFPLRKPPHDHSEHIRMPRISLVQVC